MTTTKNKMFRVDVIIKSGKNTILHSHLYPDIVSAENARSALLRLLGCKYRYRPKNSKPSWETYLKTHPKSQQISFEVADYHTESGTKTKSFCPIGIVGKVILPQK